MAIRRLGLAGMAAFLMLAGGVLQPAFAQKGVEGKWNATVKTANGDFNMVFDFKVKGDHLMGTMSNDFAGATPISHGMIKGNEISFKLAIQGQNGPMTIDYKGMLKGDKLELMSKFEGTPPGGGPAERKVMATRAK